MRTLGAIAQRSAANTLILEGILRLSLPRLAWQKCKQLGMHTRSCPYTVPFHARGKQRPNVAIELRITQLSIDVPLELGARYPMAAVVHVA